jgi:hypothetical protein
MDKEGTILIVILSALIAMSIMALCISTSTILTGWAIVLIIYLSRLMGMVIHTELT